MKRLHSIRTVTTAVCASPYTQHDVHFHVSTGSQYMRNHVFASVPQRPNASLRLPENVCNRTCALLLNPTTGDGEATSPELTGDMASATSVGKMLAPPAGVPGAVAAGPVEGGAAAEGTVAAEEMDKLDCNALERYGGQCPSSSRAGTVPMKLRDNTDGIPIQVVSLTL